MMTLDGIPIVKADLHVSFDRKQDLWMVDAIADGFWLRDWGKELDKLIDLLGKRLAESRPGCLVILSRGFV